jgi:hypothetical protein
VTNDPHALVRTVRIHARAPGAAWIEATGETMTVPAAPGARIELFAEAVGPGGATVARSGSPEAPQEATAGRAVPATATEPAEVSGAGQASSAAVVERDDGEGGGIGPGWLVLIGVGIAAAVGVALAFAILPSDSTDTQFDAPRVMGW